MILFGIDVISGSSFDSILFSRKTVIYRYSRGNDKPPTEACAWNTARFVSFGRRIYLLTKDLKCLSIVFNEDSAILVNTILCSYCGNKRYFSRCIRCCGFNRDLDK